MQQHATHSRGTNTRLDHIPKWVITAAVKGIQSALREIATDLSNLSKSTISRLPNEEKHD